MVRAFIVFNPVAGGSGDSVRQGIEDHFAGAGWDYQIYETTGEEQIARVVDEAVEGEGVDLVVAAGGDGTIAGVAGGLVDTGAPLGVLPLGTGNVFARELGIPEGTQAALELLTGDHWLVSVDAMEVGGRFFLLNVSVGLSGEMMRTTARRDKRRYGRLAYAWVGLRTIVGHQPHRFGLTIDGERRAVRASELAIANSGAMGDPALRWSPEVELDDGRIDVWIVRARSVFDYLQVGAAVVLGRQSEVPTMRHFIAEERVVVDTPRWLPVQGDGEFVGYPPVEVNVVPGAVEIAVPDGGRRGAWAGSW